MSGLSMLCLDGKRDSEVLLTLLFTPVHKPKKLKKWGSGQKKIERQRDSRLAGMQLSNTNALDDWYTDHMPRKVEHLQLLHVF